MSLIQMLVHLLAKIVSNDRRLSLSDLLHTSRMKKESAQEIGNGTVYLTRLLVKLGRLSDQCRIQIDAMINQVEQEQATKNTDHVNK